MIKPINLEKLRVLSRKIYENCSETKLNQDELENMLTAIDKLGQKYEKGSISKDTFASNDKRLKIETLRMVKAINRNVESSLKVIELMNKEIGSNRIVKG
jgi:hypothetical protein